MHPIILEALRRGERYLDRVADSPVSRHQDAAPIRRHLEQTYSFAQPIPSSELVDDVARMLESCGFEEPTGAYGIANTKLLLSSAVPAE